MPTLLNPNSTVSIEDQISLSLVLTISVSCIIFQCIVKYFYDGACPDISGEVPLLNVEDSLRLFTRMGLNFLTLDGPFCTIIFSYLLNLDNLTQALDLNLSTLDPSVLTFVLGRLRFLIANHELIFGVMDNLVKLSECIDLDFGYEPGLLEEDIRNTGNTLFRLYREIELELNIDDSDLPTH